MYRPGYFLVDFKEWPLETQKWLQQVYIPPLTDNDSEIPTHLSGDVDGVRQSDGKGQPVDGGSPVKPNKVDTLPNGKVMP